MATISDELREAASVPDKGWPLLADAADTIDALVAALETISTETDVRKSQVAALDALALASGGK